VPSIGVSVLVCFAVREEARFFRPPSHVPVQILFTGMGQPAARRAIESALETGTEPGLRPPLPNRVITAGFAGGLRPSLAVGTVVFETAESTDARILESLGALPARFHCAARVATTVAEKMALRLETQADAVEMESGIIREVCARRGIACTTVRSISDPADEALPIDFNTLISPRGTLSLRGLVFRLLAQPGCIPGLMALQRKTTLAARRLGACLTGLMTAPP
jgi:adenosylhomocysteine nucleosidase